MIEDQQESAESTTILFQKALPVRLFQNKTFSCVLFAIEEEGYQIYSVDAQGLHGEGVSEEACKNKFRKLVEARLLDEKGGIFHGRSSFEFQLKDLTKSLLKYWKEDGVRVKSMQYSEVTVFCNNSSLKKGDDEK